VAALLVMQMQESASAAVTGACVTLSKSGSHKYSMQSWMLNVERARRQRRKSLTIVAKSAAKLPVIEVIDV